ncbi:uncharacterized protein B0I36DRAFT_40963 [Microdochium trichocladiopsis]|uniref:NAD(P)-binding domain-containing protein n=1 Tax=Microdochium trichocladiopsis TaxID=1682393 RepID=A0A9P8XUG4_9PEZI|nr:uncharacterized protein B0I36DRAFT_40963 [Microdochium trichocladiopsis]KAH7018590.1 hypothetical protein B0I36DRAFT_40963 [Microdochium trichocladiopsis]
MHFLVLGGSGQNGTLVIQEALARGHSVTAMVRNPATLKIDPHPQLTVVKGTPESLSDTKSALTTPSPPSAVIITLGMTANSPANFLARATQTLLTALRELDLADNKTKLVVNSSHGVGASAPSLLLAFHLLFSVWPRMRLSQAAHEEADNLVMASGLKFVVARPARLTAGEAAEVKAYSDSGKGIGAMPSISRASVAKWLVSAAETAEWDGRAPVLAN